MSEKGRYALYLLYLMPVLLLWLFLCGGQNNVGEDYGSYVMAFSGDAGDYYFRKKEYLFAYIAQWIYSSGYSPQLGFYIFYAISFLFLTYILSKLDHKTSFIFVILFLTVSTAFNNQMNVLRQYSALYMASAGVVALYGKNGLVKFLICILLASLIHSSALIFLMFLYFRMFPRTSVTVCLVLLAFSIAFGFIGSSQMIWDYLSFLIPRQYSYYIGSHFDSQRSLAGMATKLMYVPFYVLSLKLVYDKRLSDGFDAYLFKVGFYAFIFRILSLSNALLDRVGISFIILSMFPLYILLKSWYENKKYLYFFLSILFFIAFYLFKVLAMPRQEYLYDSIYFL